MKTELKTDQKLEFYAQKRKICLSEWHERAALWHDHACFHVVGAMRVFTWLGSDLSCEND